MNWDDYFATKLNDTQQQNAQRKLTTMVHSGNDIIIKQRRLLNLASNDYLALATNFPLRQQFYAQLKDCDHYFSASSSRLLTGSFTAHDELETLLSELHGSPAALVFSSGYQMNLGILSAIADKNTLVLSDNLIHASMIDGLRLATSQKIRYKHNDINHLSELLALHHKNYRRILIVTESIFSMDGDIADLTALVQLKKQYPNVALYVDEAHAIGVRGMTGLGCAEEQHCLNDIDFLVGTFGKAIHSVGGYLICSSAIREYLINYMRPLIFSTALPPINIAWTRFILQNLSQLQPQKSHLHQLSSYLIQLVQQKFTDCASQSHIIPIIVGSNQAAINKAIQLQQHGFWVMPIRPPTVPENQARIRISLTANIKQIDIDNLIELL